MSNISDTLSNLLQILMPKILGWVCLVAYLNFKKLIENKEIWIKREKPGDEYGWSKI